MIATELNSSFLFFVAVGKGCFKCGALDHIAKECTGDSASKQQPQKYVLKNDNAQRGGGNNSRYVVLGNNSVSISLCLML